MYRKNNKSLNIQDTHTSTQQPKVTIRQQARRWKKHCFKFLFNSIEVLWRVIQAVVTLGSFLRLILEIIGVR